MHYVIVSDTSISCGHATGYVRSSRPDIVVSINRAAVDRIYCNNFYDPWKIEEVSDAFAEAQRKFFHSWDFPVWNNTVGNNSIYGNLVGTLHRAKLFDLIKEERMRCAHVSTSDRGLIAYYQTPEHLEAGRLTPIKPGKYLEKYFGTILDSATIKQWADEHRITYNSKSRVAFAKTPEEFAEVYSMRAGFNSCMQGEKTEKWGAAQKHHPVEAYAAGDLELVYIAQNGTLYARALIWRNIPEDKQCDTEYTMPKSVRVGRIYGDVGLLRSELAKLGIQTESGNNHYDTMKGARLLHIPHIDRQGRTIGAVMPYIDGYRYVTMLKGHDMFVLGYNNNESYISASETQGYIYCKCSGRSGKLFFTSGCTVYVGNGQTQTWETEEAEEFAFVDYHSGEYYSNEHYKPVEVYIDVEYRQFIACPIDDDPVETGRVLVCARSNKFILPSGSYNLPDGRVIARWEVRDTERVSVHDNTVYDAKDVIRLYGEWIHIEAAKSQYCYHNGQWYLTKDEADFFDLFTNNIKPMDNEGDYITLVNDDDNPNLNGLHINIELWRAYRMHNVRYVSPSLNTSRLFADRGRLTTGQLHTFTKQLSYFAEFASQYIREQNRRAPRPASVQMDESYYSLTPIL